MAQSKTTGMELGVPDQVRRNPRLAFETKGVVDGRAHGSTNRSSSRSKSALRAIYFLVLLLIAICVPIVGRSVHVPERAKAWLLGRTWGKGLVDERQWATAAKHYRLPAACALFWQIEVYRRTSSRLCMKRWCPRILGRLILSEPWRARLWALSRRTLCRIQIPWAGFLEVRQDRKRGRQVNPGLPGSPLTGRRKATTTRSVA